MMTTLNGRLDDPGAWVTGVPDDLYAELDDDDIVAFVSDLKAQPGGDIHLSGGARLAQTLVRLGLVDRYHLVVHPVVSAGSSWFGKIKERRGMELLGATAYSNGVVGLYYQAGGDRPR